MGAEKTSKWSSRVLSVGLGFALLLGGCGEETAPKTEFELSVNEVQVHEGEAFLVQVSGATAEVVWTSSNPSVATVNTLGVISGIETGTATVTAAVGAESASVGVTVTTPPLMVLSTPVVYLTTMVGQEVEEDGRIAIQNGGGGVLEGLSVSDPEYATQGPAWIRQISLASTSAPSTISIDVSGLGLSAGTHLADISINGEAANAPQNAVIALNVLQDPGLKAEPERVDLFAEPNGNPDVFEVAITNDGPGEIADIRTAITYFGGPGETGWLDITLSSQSTPAVLTMTARAEHLNPGSYQALFSLSSLIPGVRPVDIPITMTIAEGPAIEVARSAVSFGATRNGTDPSPSFVQIRNAGGRTLTDLTTSITYEGSASGWLTATVGAQAPTHLQIQPRIAGLGTGAYRGTVWVESPVASNTPVPVEVTLQVWDAAPPSIVLSQSSVSFVVARGGSSGSGQAVSVTNGGSGALVGLSTSIQYNGTGGWLTANLGSGGAPTTLTVAPSVGGLALGTYTASVIVSSALPGVEDRELQVELEVVPSFVSDIYGIFSANYSGYNTPCTGCHYAGGSGPVLGSGASASTVWNALVGASVIPYNPSASRLVCKIDGSCSSSTDMRLPPAQVNLIRDWIESGAPFN